MPNHTMRIVTFALILGALYLLVKYRNAGTVETISNGGVKNAPIAPRSLAQRFIPFYSYNEPIPLAADYLNCSVPHAPAVTAVQTPKVRTYPPHRQWCGPKNPATVQPHPMAPPNLQNPCYPPLAACTPETVAQCHPAVEDFCLCAGNHFTCIGGHNIHCNSIGGCGISGSAEACCVNSAGGGTFV